MERKESLEGSVRLNESIIPFVHRKSLLLSISFRALNLEMSEFKMKINSVNPDELTEALITDLYETTMVYF